MNTSNQQYALRPIAAVVGLLFATWVAQPVMAAQPATAPGAGTATQSGATTQAGTATQAGTVTQEAAGETNQNQTRPGEMTGSPVAPTTTVTALQPNPMLAAEPAVLDPLYEGMPVGSFLLYPSATLTVMSDDNIYGTRTSESRDVVTTVTPSVVARSNWDKHRLNLNAGVSADMYDKYSTEDVTDWWVGADGRYDLGERTNVFAGARASFEHEDRASFESRLAGGSEPTTYDSTHMHVGAAHKFDKLNLRAAYVEEALDFNNPAGMAAGTSNDDRDRTLRSVAVRAGVPVSERNELFVQAASDERKYDRTLDDNLFQRSSDGHRVSVGINSKLAENMQIEGFAGEMQQDYDDPRFATVTKPYYGGRFSWQPDNRTRVTASLDRAINETTLANASSYVETSVTGRVEREIGPKTVFSANLTHSEGDYQGVSLTIPA